MVRFAREEDLGRVNELRKMVNDVHVAGRPDVFQPGFGEEIKAQASAFARGEDSGVLVAICGGVICGFAMVKFIDRPASAYSLPRRFCHIDEFGVDAAYRRRGVATQLIEFLKKDAKEKGFARIELDVWEFNEDAREFYEAVGFTVSRRFMELAL
jgi:ribosomal protein S18 acetylase RimI-like enzyme